MTFWDCMCGRAAESLHIVPGVGEEGMHVALACDRCDPGGDWLYIKDWFADGYTLRDVLLTTEEGRAAVAMVDSALMRNRCDRRVSHTNSPLSVRRRGGFK